MFSDSPWTAQTAQLFMTLGSFALAETVVRDPLWLQWRPCLECKWGHQVWTKPKTVNTSRCNPDVYMRTSDRCWRDGLVGQLELAKVPLVHVVVSHQLIAPGELLLAVGPPTVERLLAWEVGGGGRRRREIRGAGRVQVGWNNSKIK